MCEDSPVVAPSSLLLLPGSIRQDQSVINGVLCFCPLEASFPRPQSVRWNLWYILTSWRAAGWFSRLASSNGGVVNMSSDGRSLKNDFPPFTLVALVVAGRLFSLCRSVLPGAWWRSPHRSMGMGSCGADALRGSRWLRSRLVYFLLSEGKLCSQGLPLQHSSPPWLHPSKINK